MHGAIEEAAVAPDHVLDHPVDDGRDVRHERSCPRTNVL
jgi:hypothetical protein